MTSAKTSLAIVIPTVSAECALSHTTSGADNGCVSDFAITSKRIGETASHPYGVGEISDDFLCDTVRLVYIGAVVIDDGNVSTSGSAERIPDVEAVFRFALRYRLPALNIIRLKSNVARAARHDLTRPSLDACCGLRRRLTYIMYNVYLIISILCKYGLLYTLI